MAFLESERNYFAMEKTRSVVLVTHSMRDLHELAGEDPLRELKERCECRIWPETIPPGREGLLEALKGCDGLLCLISDRIDGEMIRRNPALRVISSCSVGVDHIDLAAASALGIPVGNTPGVLTDTTADLTFALMLAAARRIAEGDVYVRSGKWKSDSDWGLASFLGVDLTGATLGIVGLGGIGQAVARRALGFGMRVIGWSRSGNPVEGVENVAFAELLSQSDFVSVNVALAPETEGLFDARAIASMKPGAVLVNTARGGIVDDRALAKALSEKRLAAAGLDVFEGEPIDSDHPLTRLNKVVMTPHIGSASIRTRFRMAQLSVQNCLAGLEGRPLLHTANQDQLT
ncbi:MAG: D-glycerate dehydrogenase [Myxococcota bacterium]|nr:D-glycerate dehydrogenase [Myxococcota bacterium]